MRQTTNKIRMNKMCFKFNDFGFKLTTGETATK